MKRWERNIRALAQRNWQTAAVLEQRILKDNTYSIQAEKLNDNTSILKLSKDGYQWRLNSCLDPQTASKLYADQYQVKPFYRYFIFGFSDGRIIRQLLEKCDDSNLLLIYEPDKEIFAQAVLQYDLEDLFLDHRVWIGIPETWEQLENLVAGVVEFSYIKLVEFCILPAYNVLYPNECKTYINEVVERIHYEIAEMKTSENFNRELAVNAMFHMRNIVNQRNCFQIKKELECIEHENIPAIIIAAGPSLDKNIHRMKSVQGKAFIFVVDAALRTVIREGIRPDLVCTTDPRVPERFFETAETHKFLWACTYWTSPQVIKKYGGKVFYYNSLMHWWDEALRRETKEPLPIMESGGSVSTDAFQLARYFGFRTIIFVGQDLAFTGGQSHTKGIGDILGGNDSYIGSRKIVQVEDADGNLLETDFQMDYYRRWFEKQIEKDRTGLRVIDATEGGAKIKGTIIQPLSETLEQECKREIGLHRILEEIPPAFNEVQKNCLNKKILGLEDLKREFYALVETEIMQEKKLAEEYCFMDSSQIAFELKKIMEQNEKLEQHPFINWIEFYSSKEERELKENICTKEDMDIPEMMEQSIRLMEAYQAAAVLFEEDFQKAVLEDVF